MDWDRLRLHAAFGTREVWIWGAMIVGQGVCRALQRAGMTVAGFIDSSPAMQGQTALGYPVSAPETVLERARNADAFIIIGSGHHDQAIEDRCRAHGLTAERDYLSSRRLNDIDPSIDVSGMCNLHCISCPQGNLSDRPPTGFMRLDAYTAILGKLLDELPFLGSIQLYAWGEPLLNRQLPDMIAATREARVLSAISTNLKTARDLEAVVTAPTGSRSRRPAMVQAMPSVTPAGIGIGFSPICTGSHGCARVIILSYRSFSTTISTATVLARAIVRCARCAMNSDSSFGPTWPISTRSTTCSTMSRVDRSRPRPSAHWN